MTWRPAQPADLSRLWPAMRAAHVATSPAGLEAFYAAGPWRVRVSDSGDAMVLKRWRAHLDALAIRTAWTPPHRVSLLVAEARAVARAQGFSTVVSPLAPEAALDAYLREGMTLLESLIALQGATRSVMTAFDVPTLVSLRRGRVEDLPALVELDRTCFEDFWRYGPPEFEEVLAAERVVVAERGGDLVGYSSALVVGSTCTIGRLAVAPHARRHGVGAALLRDAARWAHKQRALGISLCTQLDNEASRSLYRKARLEESEERFGLAWCAAADAAPPSGSTHSGG